MADKDFRIKNGIHVGANAYIEGSVTSVDSININTAAAVTVAAAGAMAWNTDYNTLDIGMNANTVLHAGQQQFYYVKNATGSAIPSGVVVMANGTNGASGVIQVTPAIANGTFPSKYIMGVTTEAIPDGEDGFVTAFGKIRGLNTSAFSEGDILYANPAVAGGLSNTAPIAPNNIVTVAIVINKHPSAGTLFVRPSFGNSITESEGIFIRNTTDGQVLTYINANSRFENKTVEINNVDGLQTALDGKLNLTGGTLTGDLTIPDKIIHSGDTNTAIRFPAADTVTIETAGSERLRVVSGGNVGINTANPVKKLTMNVSPSSSSDDGIRISDGSNFTILSRTGSDYTYRGVSANASMLYSNSAMAFLSDDTTIGITFHNAGNERMRITPTGNVGIGTSSPAATLDIPGHTSSYNTAQFGAFGIQSVDNTNGFLSVNGYWTGTDWIYRSNGVSSLLQFSSGDILLRTVPSGISGEIGAISTRLTVKNTGNIGIGTGSPATLLDVAGDVTITDKIIHSGDTNTSIRFPANDTVAIETAGNERMRIDSNGRIGIGTAAPDVGLHYVGDTPKFRIESTNSLDTTLGTEEIGRIEWEGARSTNRNVSASIRARQDGTWSVVTPWLSPTALEFYTQDNTGVEVTAPRLSIGPTGNVGIGTTSPATLLDVAGDVTITDKIIHSGDTDTAIRFPAADTVTIETAGSEAIRVVSGGNVSIGTTTAAAKLTVSRLGGQPSAIPALDAVTTALFHSGAGASGSGSIITLLGGNTSITGINFADVDSGLSGRINYSHSADAMLFYTSTFERMRITSDGNVGIGTSAPSSLLEIATNANSQTLPGIPTLRITNTDTTATANDIVGSVEFFSKDASDPDVVTGFVRNIAQDAGVSYGLAFGTKAVPIGSNATERMRIASTGFIGIGTTAPQRTLHIAAASPELIFEETDQAADETRWRISLSGSDFYTSTVNDAINAGETAYRIARGNGVSVETHIWHTANAERMRLASTGFLGIGTTAPDSPLTVVTSGATAANFALRNTTGQSNIIFQSANNSINTILFGDTEASNSGVIQYVHASDQLLQRATGFMVFQTGGVNERMRVTATGNVGIGTSVPAVALDVNGSIIARTGLTSLGTLAVSDAMNYNGASVFFLRSRLNGGTVQIGTETPAGTLYYPISIVGATDYTSFSTSTSEVMRIIANGNVGIGTTTPATLLDVNGDVTIADKIIHSGDTNTSIRFPAADTFTVETAGNEAMRVASSGNVGIGTSSPAERLHISGFGESVLVTPVLYSSNQDSAYMIASATNYDGTTTNWGTYGFQHKLKSSAGGVPRVTIDTSTGEKYCITDDGFVGIGTSEPQFYNLNARNLVVGTTSGNNGITIASASTGSGSLHFADGIDGFAEEAAGYIGYNHSSNYMVLGTLGTERMRISSGGLIGIGTSSPAAPLHVAGDSMIGGVVYRNQAAQAVESAAATLTIAELLTGIIQYTGSAATLTLPTGTAIEGGVPASFPTNMSFDFSIINTGSGTATLGTATGLTLVGSMAVSAATSGLFRVRKTATNTYTLYRIS